MARAHNFNAGPGALPEEVLLEAREELLDWRGEGASVLELSHRGKAFVAMAEEAEARLRRILGVPGDYAVLFLQGGATQHFALIPMNLAAGRGADYVLTGAWGEKALREGARVARARVAASAQAGGYRGIPPRADWDCDPEAAYLHLTPNETIHGVEFHDFPATGEVPLVADMSSTLLSRPLDVRRFGLIYAGAQKNIGPAGLVVLIVRRDLLERCPSTLPDILSYRRHAEEHSMLNTPPTFAWYLAGKVFAWIERQGGLEAMGARNRAKAERLYRAIDGSGGFYRNPVDPACRSWMNVPFTLADPALEGAFLREAEAAGLIGLKGHRSVGGMRASLYNAVPPAAVEALVDFMGDFARRHG
ncbi:MAG: 3-phosphoserine/phosphohydroxythreonine transaminase [Xanthomonadales bacterium]|nr:3-phosphoserine/phosphohydroxythreonine transaminase [Xanthomonadales bacterium]